MYEIDDPKFRELVCRGFSLEELERRLKPALFSADDYKKDLIAHAGFGDFSQEGFIGYTENLLQTIYQDWQTVEKLGTSHKEIADALENPRRLAAGYEFEEPTGVSGDQSCPWGCNKFGDHVGIIKKKGVEVLQVPLGVEAGITFRLAMEMMGELKKDAVAGQKEFVRRIDEEMVRIRKEKKPVKLKTKFLYAPLTGLLPHLICKHHFFEGRESPYRTDPEFLIRAFGLGIYSRR
jgi:hypothetical protein